MVAPFCPLEVLVRFGILATAAMALAVGCGPSSDSQKQPAGVDAPPAKRVSQRKQAAHPPHSTQPAAMEGAVTLPPPSRDAEDKRSQSAPPPVDEPRVESHGIRKIQGDRLTLYTDLPANEAIDRLPDVFALGVPQWCRYFKVDQSEMADWQVRGCLMKDRQRFIDSGLLPGELQFTNAFTQGNCVWWHEQETDYYRRHLMLHEGTHSFMFHHFGDCGPGWFMEGIAELLGTHHLSDGRLTLAYFPRRADEVPFWGRIKMVQEAVRTGHALSIAEVMSYEVDVELQDQAYAWCWALAAFLDGHPRYRERFRQLPGELKSDDLNRQFLMRFEEDWQALNIEWGAFIQDLDFGYDLVRNAIELHPGKPLTERDQSVAVAADRGWQSSGVHFEAGKRYQLTATGRYQVADEPKIWWCEPAGVTIRYYRGRPLGMLLAAILPDDHEDAADAWRSMPIGAHAELVAETSGTLYLRINDAPGELADNAGSLEVRVGQAFSEDGLPRPSP